MNLEGSTALITGAAHRVGKGIALSLAEQGCNILVHYHNSADEAATTVKELQSYGIEAESFSADLLDIQQLTDSITAINESYDYQILVNSAASFIKKPFHDITQHDWDTAMNLNTRAPFFLIQHTAPVLQKQHDSLIVNIGDLSGIYPWKNFTAHGVSKAALIQLTKYAARELAPIRCNAIIPGPILPPPDMKETDPTWQEMIAKLPLKKSGDPRFIGNTVGYFAENDFITGAVIKVDGGEGLVGAANH